VSAEAFHGGVDDLIFDISENDDITVVQPGWELNVGSELAPLWAIVAQASVDQSGNYEIRFSEDYNFEDFATYTFRNPTPVSKVWTINSQNGTLIAPGGAILSSEYQAGNPNYRDFSIEMLEPGDAFEHRWVFRNDATLTIPGDIEFDDGTRQSTAYLGITNEAGTSAVLAVGVSNMTRDALSVRVVAGMGSTLDVEINYSLAETSATVMGSSTTVAFTQVLTKPLNIFGGQQTLTANNTTWTTINAETLSTIGDSVTAIISEKSFHKIYRVTVIARTLPDIAVPGDAYCTIEVLK
jgi:hypothetical protein